MITYHIYAINTGSHKWRVRTKGSHCIISSLWEVRLTSKKGDATWNSHVMHMLLQEETFEF